MRLVLNLNKPAIFVLIIFGALIFMTLFVFAFNSGQDPSILGHSAEEVLVKMNDGSLKTVQELLAGGIASGGLNVDCDNGYLYFYNGVLSCGNVQLTEQTSSAYGSGTYMSGSGAGCGGSRQGMYAYCPGGIDDSWPPSIGGVDMYYDSATMNFICKKLGYDSVSSYTTGSRKVISQTDRWAYNSGSKQWYTGDFDLNYLSSVTCKRTIVAPI